MINIAIDGPSGVGKSTIAKAIAKKFGITYLDTGAMYRAVAYTAVGLGIDPKDEVAVANMLENFDMDIVFEDGAQQIFVNGKNTTPYLREYAISKAASDISALSVVRTKMVDLQRKFAEVRDIVLDGRDIGTVVLKDANCKFFLVAEDAERAKRRYLELKEKGKEVEYETVLKDIKERDFNDSHRDISPLAKAPDAELIDTTNMTIDEVTNYVASVVKEKIK